MSKHAPKTLLDTETGEILEVKDGELIVVIPEGSRVTTPAQIEALKKKKLERVDNFMRGEKFVKLYQSALPILLTKFTQKRRYQDGMVLFQMLYFADSDGMLRGLNNKPVSGRELAKAMNIDYSNFAKIINRLVKDGVISKAKVQQIVNGKEEVGFYIIINPYIYTRRTDPLKIIVDIFSSTVWNPENEMLPDIADATEDEKNILREELKMYGDVLEAPGE